jgi:xanthine dehydrogenase accessory factor
MEIHREMAEKRDAGEIFVLASIVRTAGSSPRETGAKMLVYPDGSISGTIGGGKFERLVMDDCLALIDGGRPHLLKTYRFTSSGPDATGMSCGGEAEVFMEVFTKSERLIIFGGGHVGKELVRIAEGLEFRITVVDDREDILEQYSTPVETVLTDSKYEKDLPAVDETSYVVILTRSHECDRAVLSRVIRQDVAYVGMIGSERKISETRAFLKESGIEDSLFDRVYTPIGLDIAAEGPCEIAVAIAAELIATRKKASPEKS